MIIKEIQIDGIITKKDLENGNLILLTGRPAVGKTRTCCELFKTYSKSFNCLYFDISGEESAYFFDYKNIKGVVNDYMSSIEIAKKIQYEAKHNVLRVVFIDYWQLLDDRKDWFLKILLEISWSYGVVFVITSQLSRNVEKRKNHLPNRKDLDSIGNLGIMARKQIVIGRPAIYSSLPIADELKYYVYKDWSNSSILQDKKTD